MTSPDTGRSAELQVLVDALERIADEQKVYLGHGSYNIEPAFTADEAQTIARAALTDLQSRRAGVAAQPLTFLEKINALEEAHEKGPRIYVQGWQDACQTIREALYPAFGSEHGIVREVASGQEVLGEAAQKEGGEVASAQTLPHPAPTSSMKVPKDFGGTITLGELREMIGHFYNSDRGKTAFNSLRGLLDYIEAIKPTNEMGGESRGEARQSRAEIIEEAAEEYRRAAIACREEGLNELADHFDGKYRALVGKPQRSNVGTPLI